MSNFTANDVASLARLMVQNMNYVEAVDHARGFLLGFTPPDMVIGNKSTGVVYCPECGDMFEYEMGTWLTAVPYLRFCSRKCMDTFMEDKTVVSGIVPKPR